MNRRLLLSTLTLFGVVTTLGVWTISVLVDIEAEKQLDKRLELESIAYRSVIQGLKQVSDTLYDEVLSQPEISAQVEAVLTQQGEAQDIARGTLLRMLYPSYLRLKERGTRQLHFHTPQGHSLLRLHNPLRYGDALFKVRESVRIANTQLQPVQGYEAGRLFHGFRYVYPLFHQERHVGSVEVSVAFQTVERLLQELVPNELFMFVLERDQVFSLLYPSERSIYTPFALNDTYLVEDLGARLGQPREVPALQQALINGLLGQYDTVHLRMSQGESFGIVHSLDNTYYAVMFLPINSISDEVGGYIVTFADVYGIGILYRNGSWFQGFFAAAIALLGIGYYRRKNSQLLIRKERSKLRAITDRMAEGLFVQDPQGRITYLNRAAEKMLGISANNAMGRLAHDLFHVHYDEAGTPVPINECPIRLKTETGAVYQSEDEYFRRIDNRELVPVQVTSAPFVLNDQAAGSITIFRDITQRKRYEEELKRARSEAEASAQAKADFLTNMSHEIRTPMNGILGMLDLLLETSLKPEQRDFLAVAQDSGQSLLSLLNGILDLAKLEAGKMIVEKTPFALCDTLEDTVTLFATQAQLKGLEIAVHIDALVPVKAKGDPTRLRQVVANLLGNAIKFTQAGEIVLHARLSAPPPAAQINPEDVWLTLDIRDTGMGIAPDAQARIFDSFQQADNSTTRHFGGTGLGLALSRELTLAMGGHLTLTSELGKGSTFRVELPISPVPLNEEEAQAFAPFKGQRVLIAVAHETQRALISYYCKQFGVYPEAITSQDEVFPYLEEAAKRHLPFALLIIDRGMSTSSASASGMTAICDSLHQDPRFRHLPIWYLVTYAERLDYAPSLPVAGTLVKPISRRALYTVLAQSIRPPHPAAAEVKDVDEEHSHSDISGLRVLLAEDNPVNRKVAMANLTKLGCAVTSVQNGAEALAYLQDNPVDIVLMDCMMPVMDGLKATQRWRAYENQHNARKVPIIAMTAYASDKEIASCYAAGMDAYLSKPFKPQALKDLLCSFVAGSASGLMDS